MAAPTGVSLGSAREMRTAVHSRPPDDRFHRSSDSSSRFLCLGAFRFSSGWTCSAGGAPRLTRANRLTSLAARNGLGLRRLDTSGVSVLQFVIIPIRQYFSSLFSTADGLNYRQTEVRRY